MQQRGTGLFANLQVAHVRVDGSVSMPNTTDRILLEIGCSNRATLDDQLLERDTNSFLLAFEPLLDKYAEFAAKGNKRYNGKTLDLITPLGHHHQRAVVLPLAVGAHGRTATFHVGRIAGCSSLLQLANPETGGSSRMCKDVVETRTVPMITLRSAIALTGSTLPIRLVKIDAQGADLSVVQGAPKSDLARVQLLTMEMQVDSHLCQGRHMIYRRESCTVAVDYMRSVGFRYIGHATDRQGLVPVGEGGTCPTRPKWGRTLKMWFCEIQVL